tara:strand:+ start:57 stop:272 length:216 start_codon:yes stop_codon:yes gene_type:complete
MNIDIELICPMCSVEFKTNRRDKIWCNTSCGKMFMNVKKKLDKNKIIQNQVDKGLIFYDFTIKKFKLNGRS